MKIFDNPGNSGKSSAIPAISGALPELSKILWKADNTGIYGRYRVCRNCRSIAENAGIVEIFHILDMYGLTSFISFHFIKQKLLGPFFEVAHSRIIIRHEL